MRRMWADARRAGAGPTVQRAGAAWAVLGLWRGNRPAALADGSRMCADWGGRAGSNAESGGCWLGIAGLDAADTRYSGLATFLASRRADAATGIFGTDDWSVVPGCRAHRSDYRRGRWLWEIGRAARRERVGRDGCISGVTVGIKEKKERQMRE